MMKTRGPLQFHTLFLNGQELPIYISPTFRMRSDDERYRYLRLMFKSDSEQVRRLSVIFTWKYVSDPWTVAIETNLEELKTGSERSLENPEPVDIPFISLGIQEFTKEGKIRCINRPGEASTTVKFNDGTSCTCNVTVTKTDDEICKEIQRLLAEHYETDTEQRQKPQGPLAESQDEPQAASATPEHEVHFEFSPVGKGRKPEVWRIRFTGPESFMLKHTKGMRYLHTLLSKPGCWFSALKLYSMENPPPPETITAPNDESLDHKERAAYGTGASFQYVINPEDEKKLLCRKAEAEAELRDPDATPKDIQRAEGEIEHIKKALAHCRVTEAIGGAIFEAPEIKKSRQAVSKAIEHALGKISENCGDLAKHLASIKRGGTVYMGKDLSYSGKYTWKTE